jgi:hypothetical protein
MWIPGSVWIHDSYDRWAEKQDQPVSAPGAYTYNLGNHTARYISVYMYNHAPGCCYFSFKEAEVYLTAGLSDETTSETAAISDLVSLKLDSK